MSSEKPSPPFTSHSMDPPGRHADFLVRQVGEIQNPGLGEFKIRDLNDQINKLIREKGHWEKRIVDLGGPNYFVRGPLFMHSPPRPTFHLDISCNLVSSLCHTRSHWLILRAFPRTRLQTLNPLHPAEDLQQHRGR